MMRKIKELDIVRIKKDLHKLKLKKGQKGIVALIENKEIELALNEHGNSRLVQVPISLITL